ncbi:hypothetical protein B296_00057999 [Ensete ventricosum]|uniref:Uncharacterized protein n=1 Tax=Ensete ventricosum TaxID=4639 RepID=A0A426XAS4_ENSVE|nr:hypothetical protein B296_00057999 [Ensete ventricosum]
MTLWLLNWGCEEMTRRPSPATPLKIHRLWSVRRRRAALKGGIAGTGRTGGGRQERGDTSPLPNSGAQLTARPGEAGRESD